MMASLALVTGIVAGAGLLAVGAVLVAVGLVLFPWLPRDLGGAPNLDRRARRLKIDVGGGERIDGWYVAGTSAATVLVLHGFGRDHHRAWRYGAFLNAAGFGILTVDFRSSRAMTSGPRRPTTLGHHEVPDAEAALAWLAAEPGLAGHAIGVLGESLGGAVALTVAARDPAVGAVVVDGAFATGADALEDSSERWARLPRRPTARLARWVGRAVTGCDPGALDAEAAALALTGRPAFFIHGARDNRLSHAQAERLWRASGAVEGALWIIPEAGHNEGWRLRRAEYESRVTAFFAAHLASARGGGRTRDGTVGGPEPCAAAPASPARAGR